MCEWKILLLALVGLLLLGAWLERPGMELLERLCRRFGWSRLWAAPWAAEPEPAKDIKDPWPCERTDQGQTENAA